ncbi:MAG: multiheme c-type cytochrome [Luteolibacter sp.]
MKKALFIILPIAAIAIATYVLWPQDSSPSSGKITINFTCDTAGRLEPCGCFTGQHGGLTRLRSYLEENKDDSENLRLDVGGAIAGSADYNIIQYKYLARAYKTMAYHALNMGAREAEIPAATLQNLASTSPVPLISASLVNPYSEKELLQPYEIVTIAGKKIGILGVVSPTSIPTPGQDIKVLGLNEAINKHLPALSEKTDLVILLAFADESELTQLAKDYFEFALILGGNVSGPTQEIIEENDSIILYTTNEARTVGTLKATLAGETRTRLTEPSYEIQLLWDNIPQNMELRNMVKEYRTEIRNTPLAIDDPNTIDPNAIPGVTAKAHYVGSESCKTCHQEAHDTWQGTGHAHAFQTLVDAGADADPNCIACHTVGFGKESGYRRTMGTEKLTDVSCESCHGPASQHIDKYLHGKPVTFKFRPLGPGDCKSCHYGEFSRPFDWDTFYPPIEHK